MKKFTPGPWVAHKRPSAPIEFGHNVTTNDGLTVCYVSYQLPVKIGGEVVEQERIANAHLIASAPDLLEACQVMIEWDDREKDHAVDFYARMDLCAKAFDLARAAIAKATGQSS